jgi:hypothetical protein
MGCSTIDEEEHKLIQYGSKLKKYTTCFNLREIFTGFLSNTGHVKLQEAILHNFFVSSYVHSMLIMKGARVITLTVVDSLLYRCNIRVQTILLLS